MSEYPVSEDDVVDEIAILHLPLDAWHRETGGRMVEFAGYHMPVQYEGIMAEHLWTRESAGLFDVSHMGQVFISSEEGVTPALEAAIEAALPVDLSTLKVGAPRYSLLLDENGGVLDDLMITRWASGFYLVVNGATKWDDIGTLRELLPDEVTLNHLDESALLALQGPKAFAALERHVEGDTPLESLTFMKGAAFKLGGVDAWISRSGYTGEDGFEIAIPAESAEHVADLLCGEPEVKPIGLGARDSLRLEAGLPLYGHDLSPETSAVDADLKFAINKRRREQGGFPGSDRVLRDFAQGTPRRRVGLVLEGRMAAREGARVLLNDQEVGLVTSGGFSPSLQQPIAMAYVDTALSAEGSELTIEMRGKKLDAKVVTMPFVPHRYHR
ncbi:glycine cleavage system aminomethyltransferase GcvT [Novosphingobium sp. FGD1]|uniref:aminomethyltransferase n=1 Tax=Novosphingobium silvae TaxID=2692619 RepID=A0A7X4GEP1_9SPHN|nr:glycine cleavage system aminomethyltransferase GcvT [Novosphingobium silvae]MYL96874.1 glycine cleavage system aminomethyltransferase GcvT [Novosphingobium silvae]